MARNRFRGDAPAVAQVSQFTVTATGSAADTVTVKISNKTVIATVPASPTTTTVAAAIAQACGDADAVEFTEVVWTSVGAVVYGTAATPGKPFVITSVTASGTGTFSAITTPTVSKGPNHWDDANNWTLAAVPVNTNDVDLTDCDVDILWGIDQNGVTLASLNVHSTFTGKIGNPSQEGDYFEYRETELKISATLVTIGAGDGPGSAMVKLNTGSNQTTLLVLGTSTAGTAGQPAVWWRGTHASNSATVNRGSVGVAFTYGDTATLTALRVGSQGSLSDATVQCGEGLTLTTLTVVSGTVKLQASVTTINQNGGELTMQGTGLTTTTATFKGGTWNYDGTGTVTTTTMYDGAILVTDRDPRTSKTFTNVTANKGCGFKNGNKTANFPNGVVLNCAIDDISPREFGEGGTLTF